MRIVAILAACGLAACDVFFPLSDPAIRDDAGGDLDGDGVVEGDNCPNVANADQHDEDGDQIGDACDNCPHLANPGQQNTVESPADDLGDACDIEPSTQCILLFDAFTQPPTSVGELGNWQHQAATDSLDQMNIDLDNTIFAFGDQYTAEVVVVGAHVVDFNAGDGQFHNVGIWHHVGSINAGVPSGVVAEYSSARSPMDTGPAVLHVGQPADGAPVGTMDFGTPVSMSTSGVGSDVVLRLDTRRPGIVTARAEVDTAFVELSGPVVANLQAGRVGFRAHNVVAQFRYVLVFQDRGSPCPSKP